jgi:hypothetical protein
MTASPSLRPLVSFSLAVSALCLALPGHAESFASSASSAGSASSGSVSDSIKGSSNSSTSDNKVAEGPYRVVQVAEVAEVAVDANVPDRRPMLQLTLRATEAGATREFILELPRVALADQPLHTGDVVQARHRPYGYEFARGDTQQAFFLVLTDDWQRELDSRAVTL